MYLTFEFEVMRLELAGWFAGTFCQDIGRMVIYMSQTTILVDIRSFGSCRSLLSAGLHQCVPRGRLCAYKHVYKLERPSGFTTSVCKSTLPQRQCVYDRLHLGQTSDTLSCHSDMTSNCAMSLHDDWKQGPPWNLREWSYMPSKGGAGPLGP